MIPRHLVLPEDAPQLENPCTQQQMEALDTDIQTVVDRIMAVSTLTRGPVNAFLI